MERAFNVLHEAGLPSPMLAPAHASCRARAATSAKALALAAAPAKASKQVLGEGSTAQVGHAPKTGAVLR